VKGNNSEVMAKLSPFTCHFYLFRICRAFIQTPLSIESKTPQNNVSENFGEEKAACARFAFESTKRL